MDSDKHIQIYEPGPAHTLQRAHARPHQTLTLDPVNESPHLLAYWHVLRKRRWTALTVLSVLFILVLLGTLKQKPVYRAAALLEIEKENPQLLTVQELFEIDSVSDSYLETQYRILHSDTLARRVIRELHLERWAEFNPDAASQDSLKTASGTNWNKDEVSLDAKLSQDALERFRERLQVQPVKLSRLVEIEFESNDPQLAATVVNTLASKYISQNLEARWEATQKASEWMSHQLLDVKGRLEKSETELQDYARRQGLLFLEDEKGSPENLANERLRQLQGELTRAQAARYEKESLARLVQAGEYASLPGVAESKLIEDLTVRLADLKREQAQLATSFMAGYPRLRQLQNQIDELDSILRRERARLAQRISNDYQAAVRREALVQQAFEQQQKQANLTAERSVQYNILKREVDTNKQIYQGLLQRLKEAGVSAGLKASNVRIVDSAEPPRKPARPSLALNLAVALLLGMGLGVGAAFFEEYLDDSLKSSEDVERFLGLPALALIPAAESLNGRRTRTNGRVPRGIVLRLSGRRSELTPAAPAWHRIDTAANLHSALAEAFRGLRTSVLLSAAERPPRILLVTSSQPSEGKTTVSINLALSLSQLGQRILIVDGDMRRPSVHRAFDLPNTHGLVGYLTGQQEWRTALLSSGMPNVDALACGPVPPNPAELLSSSRLRNLLVEAQQDYQFIVIDSPPLLNVADSRILATLVEGVVLVVRGGSTPRELAQRAQACARDVGANLIGVVLNNLDVRSTNEYYYRSYHYNYYGTEGQRSDDQRL